MADPGIRPGPAVGSSFDVVFGRGGSIILTFDPPVENGEGWDFAVFENSFNDFNLELAFVEVSSNGTDFFRFDAVSLTPDPVSGYGSIDTTLINNVAGKFRQGYGTPFDLSDLSQTSAVQTGILDLSRISCIRIVDIVGDGRDEDAFGHVIYDPYPTVGSAGFDLMPSVCQTAPFIRKAVSLRHKARKRRRNRDGPGSGGQVFVESLISSFF
ncbi:MAG: hypothetical protein R2875_07325 [Desulfobacterales bacterium]